MIIPFLHQFALELFDKQILDMLSGKAFKLQETLINTNGELYLMRLESCISGLGS